MPPYKSLSDKRETPLISVVHLNSGGTGTSKINSVCQCSGVNFKSELSNGHLNNKHSFNKQDI